MEPEAAAGYVRWTRAALASAGFVRKSAGGAVWWESPSRDSSSSTVVLIHGVNDQAGTWFAIAPALAARHRVIIPDLAGHGESEPATGPIAMELLVSQLAAVLASERELVLVGNSLGGWIATLFTLAHPDHVSHLVLESAGGLDRPFASPVIAHDRDEALVVLRAVHGPRFEAPEWVIEALLQRAIDSPMLRVTNRGAFHLDARLGELRLPVTLIWGADDGVLPVAYAEELRAHIAGATLHVIDGAAHIPHLQKPERVLECLIAIC